MSAPKYVTLDFRRAGLWTRKERIFIFGTRWERLSRWWFKRREMRLLWRMHRATQRALWYVDETPDGRPF